jgi:hypothetical protein
LPFALYGLYALADRMRLEIRARVVERRLASLDRANAAAMARGDHEAVEAIAQTRAITIADFVGVEPEVIRNAERVR